MRDLATSIGIAVYPIHGEELELLISPRARPLLDAKTAGRNQVAHATEHNYRHRTTQPSRRR